MALWWNGIHSRLKIYRPIGHGGSNPLRATKQIKESLVKVTKSYKYEIVNDDGSSLHPTTEAKVRDLYNRFKTNYILGRWSPVSDAAALRMVVTVMDAYIIKRKGDSNE